MLLSNKRQTDGFLSTMAAALSEDEGTIEEAIEPYLLANGYIKELLEGESLQQSYELFRLTPQNSDEQLSLFNRKD